METLKLETKLKEYQGDAKVSGKDSEKLDNAGKGPEIGNLKKKLAQKEKDLEAMTQQSKNLQREYRELADKYAATNPSDATPKKDR